MKANGGALLLFIAICSACSSRGNEPQLDTLSYEEALQAYRLAGRDETYRCVHKAANDQFQATGAAPTIAVVIDDVLYLKINGNLIELAQTEISEKSARFVGNSKGIQAGYTIIKQFNFSEYRESEDRYINFWIESASGKQHQIAFGERCGI